LNFYLSRATLSGGGTIPGGSPLDFIHPLSCERYMKIPAALLFLSGLMVLFLIPIPLNVEAQEKTAPKAKDKEEFIDYEAMLNDKLGKGITPEKNAVVLLWKAMGPTPEGSVRMPPTFFKRLGIDEPPKDGEYFIPLNTYLKNHLKLAQEDFQGIWDQQGWASKRPWEEKNYPHIAGWLKANEKPLALVMEACQRPDYYSPLVSRSGDNSPGSLVGVLLPAVQKCRELAAALTARAMLNIFVGKIDAAWNDLLTCHRLGRHIARGGTLIEELVGIAIDQIAINTDLAFLESAGLPSAKILDCLKDLQGLPPMPSIADKIDLMERYTYLQTIQFLQRDGAKALGILGGPTPELTKEEQQVLAKMDWEPAIKNASQWYDRIVAAIRLKDRMAREKEFDKIDKELQELTKRTKEPGDLTKNFRDTVKTGKNVPKIISDVLIGLLMPAFRKVAAAQDRTMQVERNLHVAFALAAYKGDEGRYPAKLDDLSPKYLASIPADLFSGKALIYKPSDKGYLLYSVGANGKDDDGRDMADSPPGDDLRVRMPLPPLKK
jgi:hypothetical protein